MLGDICRYDFYVKTHMSQNKSFSIPISKCNISSKQMWRIVCVAYSCGMGMTLGWHRSKPIKE